MKRLKNLLLMSCLVFVVSLSLGVGIAQAEDEKVKLTFFNTSAEVNNQFEEVFKVYNKIYPNVTIELIPTPIGGQQLEKFQALLASNNPPTISNLDPGTIYVYKQFFLDLEPERAKYEEIANPGAIEQALLDGKFLGIPYTVQGYGLLYNKRVLREILGESFDPSSIKTRNDLEALFKLIDAAGVAPVILHGANWSLGAHYMGLLYSLQSTSVEENREFVEMIKRGEVHLSDNKVFNGLLDTLDLLGKYNLRKNDPLVADYYKDGLDFAKGEAAFYFMGDWIWSVIGNLEDIDREYGIIPVPISNNPEDYGNTQIAVSEPKLFAIDNSGSTPQQQDAAKEFIYWLLTSDEGQSALVKDMGFNLPYKNVKIETTNIPAQAVAEYINKGKTIDIGVINYFPADWWVKTGNSVLKYFVGAIDRQKLAEEIESYWMSVAESEK